MSDLENRWRPDAPRGAFVHDELAAAILIPGPVRVFRPATSRDKARWIRDDVIVACRFCATERAIALHIAEDLREDDELDRELRMRDWRPPVKATPIIERARKYLERIDPSIAGAGGAATLMRAAGVLVGERFGLELEPALMLLEEFDQRSQPQWGKRELLRALKNAQRRALRRAA